MALFSSEKRDRLLIAGIITAAIFLRFFRIGAQSFWVDEIISLRAFTPPEGVPFWKKLLFDVHGPLYSLIMHTWSAVGSSEAMLRAPSAVVGVLAVYALYRWLAATAGRDAALGGALFMALAPFHIYYSQEMRFYALLSLAIIVSLIAYERFAAAPSLRSGALLGGSIAVAAFSHFSGLFLAPAYLASLAFSRRLDRRTIKGAAAAAGVLLILIAPWIYREAMFLKTVNIVPIASLPEEGRLRGGLTLSPWSYPYAFYVFSVGYSWGPSLAELHLVRSGREVIASHGPALGVAGILFGGLAAAGIAGAARRRRSSLVLSLIVVTIVVVSAVTLLNIKVFNVRYLMPAFPAYCAILAMGLPSARIPRIAIIAAVSAIMLASDGNYFFNRKYWREDVRGASRIITDKERPGDIILVPTVSEVFRYYYRGRNEVRAIYPAVLGREEITRRIERYLADGRRIWYLRSRSWEDDPTGIVLGVLNELSQRSSSSILPGVVLYRYEGGG